MGKRNLITALIAFATGLPLLHCKPRDHKASRAYSADLAPAEPADPRTQSVVTYAEECAREVGLRLNQLPDMSCLAGSHIDIRVDDQVLNSGRWEAFVKDGRKCDNPQWLAPTGCYSYDYGQNLVIGDVQVFLNCRQKMFPDQARGDRTLNGATTKFERFLLFKQALATGNAAAIDRTMRHAFYFNDLGMILRNSKTGKACYLTKFTGASTAEGEFFGGFIPSPGRASAPTAEEFQAVLNSGITTGMDTDTTVTALQRESLRELSNEPLLAATPHLASAGFFHNPAGGTICVTCHITGGYKWSPFMSGSGLVPSISESKTIPFLPVGEPLKAAMRTAGMIEIKSTTTSACTSCHRLVSTGTRGSRTCSTAFDMALGRYAGSLRGQYTAKYLGYPQVSWMPDGHERGTEGEFNVDYATVIRKTECCCRNPSAQGCSWKRYGPTETEVDTAWRTGAAPADLERIWQVGTSAANCNNP